MDYEQCKSVEKSEHCHSNKCKIVGIVMLAIASILTLITLNGLAIFGMFLVGIAFCGHHHWSSCMKSCRCGCCNDRCEDKCDDSADKGACSTKKTTTKKD